MCSYIISYHIVIMLLCSFEMCYLVHCTTDTLRGTTTHYTAFSIPIKVSYIKYSLTQHYFTTSSHLSLLCNIYPLTPLSLAHPPHRPALPHNPRVGDDTVSPIYMKYCGPPWASGRGAFNSDSGTSLNTRNSRSKLSLNAKIAAMLPQR